MEASGSRPESDDRFLANLDRGLKDVKRGALRVSMGETIINIAIYPGELGVTVAQKLVNLSVQHLFVVGRQSPVVPAEPPKPPKIGFFILALTCKGDTLEVTLGDLEQDYAIHHAKRGKFAATWWYSMQILKSSVHFTVRALKEAVLPVAELFRKSSGG